MSKVSDMLALFDKPKKTEPEKKAPMHMEKAKPPPSNSTVTKNEPIQNKNNAQPNNKPPVQNTNSIANRMNMFENKNKKIEEKIIPNKKPEKEEKKVENQFNSNKPNFLKDKKDDKTNNIKDKKEEKEKKEKELDDKGNMQKKASMFESGQKFLEKINKQEISKENNEIKGKEKDNQIRKVTVPVPVNKTTPKKEENKNNAEVNKGPSIFERMKMFNSNTNNNNNAQTNKNIVNNKVNNTNKEIKSDKKEINKEEEKKGNNLNDKIKELPKEGKNNKEEMNQIKKEEKKINNNNLGVNKNIFLNNEVHKKEEKVDINKKTNNLQKIEEKEKNKNEPIKLIKPITNNNFSNMIKNTNNPENSKKEEKPKEINNINNLKNIFNNEKPKIPEKEKPQKEEIKKPSNNVSEMLKKFSNQEAPKKEIPKPNEQKEPEQKRPSAIADRLKMFANNGTKEQPKSNNIVNKPEKNNTPKVNNENIKKEEVDTKEKPKPINNIFDKNKNIFEKETPKKEEPKKINKFINDINDKNKPINNIGRIKIEEKEKPKEEIKRFNINDKIKNMEKDKDKDKEKEKKSVEEPKKITNLTTNKFMNLNNKKEEKPKEKEDPPKKSSLISDRLKFMQGGGNAQPKKPERPQVKFNEPKKPKEDIPKNIKPISAFPSNNIKKIEPSKEEPKRMNHFQEKNNKAVNNIGTIKKEEQAKPPGIAGKFGFGFADRLKQMNALFKNQGKETEKRRGHSVMVSSSRLGFGNKSNWKDAGANNLGIINEEPDKMKPGYDPADNLKQRLDHIVVKKNKRKKTIVAFKG